MMAALAAFVAIMGIMSTVAFQEYAEILRRDNEAEMMFRAQEIVRAIQRYRIDHGGIAPLELDQLMEPGPKGNYYLRRMYEDPLVPDGKWGLLYVGPGNQIIDPNSEDQRGLAEQAGQGLGAFNQGQRTGLSGRGSSGSEEQMKQDRNSGGLGSGDRGGGNQGGRMGGSRGLSGNSRQGFGRGGFGGLGGSESTGLPIAGVRTKSEDRPFRVYNGLTEYKQWLFTYFDLENQKLPGQNSGPGRGRGRGNQRGGGLGNPGGSGFGNGQQGNGGRPGTTGIPRDEDSGKPPPRRN